MNYHTNPYKTYSEAIVLFYCEDVKFVGNDVKVRYNTFNPGESNKDSVYVLKIKSDSSVYDYDWDDDNLIFTYPILSKNAIISNNTFDVVGHNYVYGIDVSAENFEVSNNKFTMSSENYYANAITITELSSNGNVLNNNISVSAVNATYAIYTYRAGHEVKDITYENNIIDAQSYMACGMEIDETGSTIKNNKITTKGNYTHGIVLSSRTDEAQAKVIDNVINSLGTNIGIADTGDTLTPKNSRGISVWGNALIQGNNITSTNVGIRIAKYEDANVIIKNNKLDVEANSGVIDNFAIHTEGTVNKLDIIDNDVVFSGLVDYQFVQVGTTESGWPIYDSSKNTRSYGVYVKDSDAVIKGNKFDISIPTFANNWGDVRETFSEGVVLVGCDDVVFEGNDVVVTANGGSSWDSIYGLEVWASMNPVVKNNNITLNGKGYSYAIIINDNNFNISENNIVVSSDKYACGVDVEGTAIGEISKNNITATAPSSDDSASAYPIYSGMNYMPVTVDIKDNNIKGEAYYVVGIELGGTKALIENNNVEVTANYGMGIASTVDDLTVDNNKIGVSVSNEGSTSNIYDTMGSNSTGIKVASGNSTISNNNVQTTADYAVDLGENNATIKDNYLTSDKGAGDETIAGTGNITSSGNPETNNPYLKTVMFGNDLTKVYGSPDQYAVKILDENGNPVANRTITIAINGESISSTTDSEGVALFDINLVKGEYTVKASFAGDDKYGLKSTSNKIIVNAKPTVITAPAASVLLTAVKKGYIYKITLKDNSGNILANQKVTINGKEFTTGKDGVVNYKLSASKEGSQKLTVNFAGDDKYAASTATATIKINKEATKLTAKKATFKAKKKSKKYSVILKDSKGKAISKVTVKIKVGKKTYSAKTNNKGKTTFNLKKLTKKGKYTAKITFKTTALYKAATASVKITVKK